MDDSTSGKNNCVVCFSLQVLAVMVLVHLQHVDHGTTAAFRNLRWEFA